MPKKRILILGAGLAGLSAAWHLQKKGVDCQIFERESEPGGLCRSKNINGFTFDCDGHLLHFKHDYTFNLLKDLLGRNLCRHKRSAWVYSYGKYTRYPFQANLHRLPANVAKECLLGFIKASSTARHSELNFLDWLNQTFGSGIARHFMIPYNTKFWTLPPQELTCEWLDGFIPVPSLSQVVEGTLEESRREFGYNACFWYPKKGGISEVPSALAKEVKNIHTKSRVTEINLAKKEIRINSGNKEKFDYLVSSIPLPEMARLIKSLPAKISSSFDKLSWNSIFNLNLGLDKKDTSGRHWAYFPQKEISFFRVGFPHNFSASLAPEGKSSLYAEVSYSKDKPVDKKNILSRIIRDLKSAGLLASHCERPEGAKQSQKICARDINDIKYGYPIYDANYKRSREMIMEFLARNNVIPCGRYGSWRYMSMEDVILDGKNISGFLPKNA